jgi:hypothetical protein
MEELATRWEEHVPESVTATVKSTIDGKYLLADQNGRVTHATRAASCMLKPEIADRVLLCHTEVGNFVLAVLIRDPAHKSPSKIEIDGDVDWEVTNGRLGISAEEGICVSTPSELLLLAAKLGITGEAMSAAFQKIDCFGNTVEAQLNDMKIFSKRLRTRVETALQHFGRRQSTTETVDIVKAGSIKQSAKDLLTLRSAFTFIKAKKDVKVDAKQIFMG